MSQCTEVVFDYKAMSIDILAVFTLNIAPATIYMYGSPEPSDFKV